MGRWYNFVKLPQFKQFYQKKDEKYLSSTFVSQIVWNQKKAACTNQPITKNIILENI